MLIQLTEHVLVRQSAFCQTRSVVVRGRAGVLVVDPGVHDYELSALADELAGEGDVVAAGFATHPHWDHLLWHPRLGDVERYGTARCAMTARTRRGAAREEAARTVPDAPVDLLGALTGLAPGTCHVPWDGPRVRIFEHDAHAPGHAALLVEDDAVLVAGDMLSDVEIPLLDLDGPADPVEDYLDALRLFADLAPQIGVVVPGHGAVGDGVELHRRIAADRDYLTALRDGAPTADLRLSPSAAYGRDWLPAEHDRQVRRLAAQPRPWGPRTQR